MDRVTVPARGSFAHTVSFAPEAVPAVLRWSFSTEGRNIRFGVFRRDASSADKLGSLAGSLAGNGHNLSGADRRRPSTSVPRGLQAMLTGPRALSFPAGGERTMSHARSASLGILELGKLNSNSNAGNSGTNGATNSATSVNSVATSLASVGSTNSTNNQTLNSTLNSTLNPSSNAPSITSNRLSRVLDSPSPPPPPIAHSKSLSSTILTEPNLTQLIPLSPCESSKSAIDGCYTISQPGEYVLFWDNSFSLQTPKKLIYSVSVDGVSSTVKVLVEGWISKKRQKRMQGWAKRWFRLLSDGTLEYSERHGSEVRGIAQLAQSIVTLDPSKLRIDVDSGSQLFHMKCLNEADYTMWTNGLRSFESVILEEPTESEGMDMGMQLPVLPTLPSVEDMMGSFSMASEAPISDPLVPLALTATTVAPIVPRTEAATTSFALPAVPKLSPIAQEDPYDILKPLIPLVSSLLPHSGHLEPHLAYIQVQLQRAAELLLLGGPSSAASVRLGMGRFKKRAGSILSAATGLSEERWWDAEEGEEDEFEEFEGESEESVAGTPVEEKTEVAQVKQGEGGVLFRPRRTGLPFHAPSESPISIMSILRQNMGKDLSTVTMPIGLNEPLSALQRLAEEFEYAELLDRARGLSSAVERLAFLAAFAVSGYASTILRAGRKPFNPLLCETYELVDDRIKFVAEKVGHHPPVLAYRGEGAKGGWQVWGDWMVKSKFWGKTMEFLPLGSPVHVTLDVAGGKEHYTFNRLTSCMRNVIGGGTRYLEHVGELQIRNHTTGHCASLTFKEQGYFGGAKNEVVGSIKDENGREAVKLSGRWDELLAKAGNGGKGETLEVLWRPEGFPPAAAQKLYGFTAFAVGLNDVHEELRGVLPRTDSRLRPDQRLFEQGLIDQAEAEKARLENKQREARKEGREAKARWFGPEDDRTRGDGGKTWVYKGGYWEARERRAWPADLPDIF